MRRVVNEHSYLIVAAVVTGAAVVVSLVYLAHPARWAVVALAVVLVAWFQRWNARRSAPPVNIDELGKTGSGRPVVLEFYSNL